jgi:hypothetical protein
LKKSPQKVDFETDGSSSTASAGLHPAHRDRADGIGDSHGQTARLDAADLPSVGRFGETGDLLRRLHIRACPVQDFRIHLIRKSRDERIGLPAAHETGHHEAGLGQVRDIIRCGRTKDHSGFACTPT